MTEINCANRIAPNNTSVAPRVAGHCRFTSNLLIASHSLFKVLVRNQTKLHTLKANEEPGEEDYRYGNWKVIGIRMRKFTMAKKDYGYAK